MGNLAQGYLLYLNQILDYNLYKIMHYHRYYNHLSKARDHLHFLVHNSHPQLHTLLATFFFCLNFYHKLYNQYFWVLSILNTFYDNFLRYLHSYLRKILIKHHNQVLLLVYQLICKSNIFLHYFHRFHINFNNFSKIIDLNHNIINLGRHKSINFNPLISK